MVYCISCSDFSKQREDASNSSNYSSQEYSSNFHKKYSKKHKSCLKSYSFKQHHSRSHSSSFRQASSSSNYSLPEKYDNSSHKGKQHGSSFLKKSSNKQCHRQIDEQLFNQNRQIYLLLLKHNDDLNEIKNNLKQQRDGALSQESVEIIAAVESTISDENEYTIVEITSETQEQTTTQNALNSREVNDELFSV
ncbi:16364_t:CDS:2 [Cetraspora pellucida]|uniref:16364_t:CDS:1 n=1 Tax=Cetraspora pellucida TaxID=1433469 RepID=A0A9N9CS82_9GLOM|nr:16364_t:CDS:2 [Cetraspora pellucida]